MAFGGMRSEEARIYHEGLDAGATEPAREGNPTSSVWVRERLRLCLRIFLVTMTSVNL